MDKETYVDLMVKLNITLKDFIEEDRVELTIEYYGILTLLKICKLKNWDVRNISPELMLFSILFLGG